MIGNAVLPGSTAVERRIPAIGLPIVEVTSTLQTIAQPACFITFFAH
ncbi:hypothetical protein J2W25_003000 [Variovorax boronicumulans]|uniref:Uncharacterized protein n=1 Tax=Variovorax boronicumulans TaxID=436515 RepID=A0AAW8DWM5_9BURK|nr:hypothetical protein [Variovorax boronicumulans]